MKKSIILTVLASFALLFAGCGSDGDATPAISFTGEWHLVRWNGTAPTEFDAYVAFDDRTFALYQRIEQVEYQLFTGSWAYNGKLLTGIYADGTTWGSDYEVALDETQHTLTLTSPTAEEVSVYQRAAIPEDIKHTAKPSIASRTEVPRLL